MTRMELVEYEANQRYRRGKRRRKSDKYPARERYPADMASECLKTFRALMDTK